MSGVRKVFSLNIIAMPFCLQMTSITNVAISRPDVFLNAFSLTVLSLITKIINKHFINSSYSKTSKTLYCILDSLFLFILRRPRGLWGSLLHAYSLYPCFLSVSIPASTVQ